MKKLEVDRLFGYFNYVLDFDKEPSFLDGNLAILYGDNGSGKTTILRLLFHILSPVDAKGHKTFIADIEFSRVQLLLNGGILISAQRQNNKTKGPIHFSVQENGVKIEALYPFADLESEHEKVVNAHLFQSIVQKLKDLNVEVLFMRDTRRITSSWDASTNAREQEALSTLEYPHFSLEDQLRLRLPIESRSQPLEDTVDSVLDHFRELALSATNKGDVDTNNIYQELVKQLVQQNVVENPYQDLNAELSVLRFLEIIERNKQFVEVGLTSEITDQFLGVLESADQNTWPIVASVLNLYRDSVEARLNALEPVMKKIFRLIDSLNSFFQPSKNVEFNLRRGLKIFGHDRVELTPATLSSGERQLLAIFCQVIKIGSHTTVFAIDEPELSLNVKWQRKFIANLLSCTEGASVQLIMASHSIDLISPHDNRVVPLKHVNSEVG